MKTMKIPVAKPFLGVEEADAAHAAVLSHWVTQGPRVQEFEENFANFVGSKHAIAVSNCTTGLHLAMLLAEIGAGDEVICPSMSYIATANCIVYAGAKPVFAEVGQDYNLDLEDTRSKIGPKTKAILVVHQVGLPADIDGFRALCDEHNLILIEDAACAAGSVYRGKKIGSHSDLVVFSFHPRKVITTGDGGMITTSRDDFAARARLLRQHGMSVNDRIRHEAKTVIMEDHLEVGYNYRLTDIQAAVGIHQLHRLPWLIEERSKIAEQYLSAFKNLPGIILPAVPENCSTNWQSFSVLLDSESKIDRNELMQVLLDRGVSTRRGVMNSHRATAYAHRNESLPYSEMLEDRSIILPLYVPMTEEEVAYVIHAFTEEILRLS